MLTFSLGMMAQEEKPKSNWIVGEQESSFPGQMIKYAVCQSPTVIKGEKGDITVSLNIMEFRDNTSYFFKSTGEDFKVDYNVTQRVLLQMDDESENFYALEGSNNHTSNTLKFPGSYKNKFMKFVKNKIRQSSSLHTILMKQYFYQTKLSFFPEDLEESRKFLKSN